ncbi:hypothetical protein [Flavobacterium chungangensis]|uniref:Uncharacterized protein n=1 Tax=Flavobacterium chungangensis TaxID=2708132 RepID=A0ABV8ZDC6_9FLAO
MHPTILEHEVLIPVCIEKKTIISENIVKLDNISPSIFAPPPNVILPIISNFSHISIEMG